MSKALSFVLVMTVATRGSFRRAGVEFSRDWRALQVGDEVDLSTPIPTIDAASLEKIKAEPMLVVKEASAKDIEELQAALADSRKDKDVVIADLQAKNADLEARLMKLELAASAPKKTEKVVDKGGEKVADKAGGEAKG